MSLHIICFNYMFLYKKTFSKSGLNKHCIKESIKYNPEYLCYSNRDVFLVTYSAESRGNLVGGSLHNTD